MASGSWDPAKYGQWEDFSILSLIDWVICGGESGTKARRCHIDWLRSIAYECQKLSIPVPVFVKQIGSNPVQTVLGHEKCYGADSKGGNMDYWPDDLKDIREFPILGAKIS